MKKLVCDFGQRVVLVSLFIHPCEFGHVYQATVEDDLSLRVSFVANELIGLNLALSLER